MPADGADRESEERVVLSQELGSASIESGGGGGKTETSTGLVDRKVLGELADHEEEESYIEKGEDGNQGDVDPQSSQTARRIRSGGLLKSGGRSQEDECYDKPGSQKDPDSIGELARGIGVGGRNTKVRMKEGSVGQPETAIRGES